MDPIAIASFLQTLFQILSNMIAQELHLEHSIQVDVQSLSSTAHLIVAVLQDAAPMEPSLALKVWFEELRDVAYEAIEIIDGCFYENRRRQLISLKELRNSLTLVNPRRIIFRHVIDRKMQDVVKRMNQLHSNHASLKFDIIRSDSRHDQWSIRRQSSSLAPEFVFAREGDKKKIVDMLFRWNGRSAGASDISVLPILGPVFIGKTAVAQLIYNDETLGMHFKDRMWVHVSHEFQLERLTCSMIEALDRNQHESVNLDILQRYQHGSINLDTLQRHLQKQLQGRRYLLILDDVWIENGHQWDNFKRPLLNGAPGSRMIVTTRSEAVARTVGTMDPYHLKGLLEDDWWCLVNQYALGSKWEFYSDIEVLKGQILKKCNGVPFSAIKLGRALREELDRSKWPGIVERVNRDVNDDYRRAEHLSYQQLEPHLRPCFAYCSIFPPGHEFEEELIIQLWMAQSIIQPNQGERIGCDYFARLVDKSFIQRLPLGGRGEKERYTMSTAMHQLATHVSAQECCIMDVGGHNNPPEKVRHMTVIFKQKQSDFGPSSSSSHCVFETAYRFQTLHTLIVLGGSLSYQLTVPNDIASHLGSLRTLDLSDFGLTELPDKLGDLIHLRCLLLRNTCVRRLPESISHLFFLQVLSLRNCYFLEELPRDTRCLRELMHLDIHLDDPMLVKEPSSLSSMPACMGLLVKLQTLSRFVVSKKAGCSISELNTLNNLHGELFISKLDLVTKAEDAEKANICGKWLLQHLGLSWDDKRPQGVDPQLDMQVLSNLKPHKNIRELNISGYGGITFPNWLGDDTYSNLVTLRLSGCKSCCSIPQLGRLPLLEDLYLIGVGQLTKLDCGSFCGHGPISFPSLRKLHLEGMDILSRWHGDDNCTFRSLQELVIKNCPKLERLSHSLPNLEKLTIDGCPKFCGLRSFPSLKHVDVNVDAKWFWDSWPRLAGPSKVILHNLKSDIFPSQLKVHTSLQDLEISHCQILSCIPDDWPPCSNLRTLSIKQCPLLHQLPKGVQFLKSLKELVISECRQLTALPELRGLASLLKLEISGCPSLSRFPSSGVPNSLEFLSIDNCPMLSSHFINVGRDGKVLGGVDGMMLARVFSVWIDKKLVISDAPFHKPAKSC